MSHLAIQTMNLTKIYKGDLGRKPTLGVDALNLEVHTGEVFAFLGPNGAGKTTTIKLLTRLLYPSKGKIRIFGEPSTSIEVLGRVGYLPEQPTFYGYLSGRECLDFIGRLFGLDRETRQERTDALLKKVGLENRSDVLIRNYSRGMNQRLGLAQAIINDPLLVVLDEPMASLDPIGRKDFRDLILDLKQKGTTIFFSSHILSDAEMIADRVGILNKGKLVRVGKLDDLIQDQTAMVEVTFRLDPDKKNRIDIDSGQMVVQGDRRMVVLKDESEISGMLKRIEKWGGRVVSVVPRRKGLESFFIEEIGR